MKAVFQRRRAPRRRLTSWSTAHRSRPGQGRGRRRDRGGDRVSGVREAGAPRLQRRHREGARPSGADSKLSTSPPLRHAHPRREQAMEGCIEVNCSVLGGPGSRPTPVGLRAADRVGGVPLASPTSTCAAARAAAESRRGAWRLRSDASRPPSPTRSRRQVQENAVTAFEAVDAAGVARVDSFVRESTGETWVMEINTMPGSFSFYLWEETGLSFADLVRATDRYRARGARRQIRS